jgi:hypothetical protein
MPHKNIQTRDDSLEERNHRQIELSRESSGSVLLLRAAGGRNYCSIWL